jgi:hypothetical protein
MPLPPSGPITLNEVNVELGNLGTSQISMDDAVVRALFQVPSGQISMSDGYGKSSQYALTISTNQTNLDLHAYALTDGWPGSSKLVATISPGVSITSPSTGSSAMTISGAFPGGVEVINNGSIIGRGGNAGAGGSGFAYVGPGNLPYGATPGAAGGAGGTALSVSSTVTITNNGTIAGGGGGGGGSGGAGANLYVAANPKTGTPAQSTAGVAQGGPGGGGGAGSGSGGSGGPAVVYTSPGYAPGYAGSTAPATTPGSGGAARQTHTSSNPGSAYYLRSEAGGAGGALGASGSTGGGTSGYPTLRKALGVGGAGGAAGAAVSGDPYITWPATGTRLGPIS